ncbi:MAG: hypothetical protein RLZZ399_2221 [Verrucomicrobiota bacterium]|jgi:hypothetical protein
MDRSTAQQQLRAACNQISAQVTQMHQGVPALSEPTTQAEILKALFELTKQVEVVKKQLIRLEGRLGADGDAV